MKQGHSVSSSSSGERSPRSLRNREPGSYFIVKDYHLPQQPRSHPAQPRSVKQPENVDDALPQNHGAGECRISNFLQGEVTKTDDELYT